MTLAEDPRRIRRKDFIELVLAVVAIIGLVPIMFLYHEKRTNERQAQAVVDQSQALEKLTSAYVGALKPQLSASCALLGASLLSSITKGTPTERESALFILDSTECHLAGGIRDISGKTAIASEGGQLAQDAGRLSIQAKRGQEFTQHLEQARVRQRFGDFAEAYREYVLAAGVAPAQSSVDPQILASAKSKYDAGDFPGAASVLANALGADSSQ